MENLKFRCWEPVPAMFTLETLNAFNMYPIGYDDHIIEYMPTFTVRAK
jgi:hypothetical protein